MQNLIYNVDSSDLVLGTVGFPLGLVPGLYHCSACFSVDAYAPDILDSSPVSISATFSESLNLGISIPAYGATPSAGQSIQHFSGILEITEPTAKITFAGTPALGTFSALAFLSVSALG